MNICNTWSEALHYRDRVLTSPSKKPDPHSPGTFLESSKTEFSQEHVLQVYMLQGFLIALQVHKEQRILRLLWDSPCQVHEEGSVIC